MNEIRRSPAPSRPPDEVTGAAGQTIEQRWLRPHVTTTRDLPAHAQFAAWRDMLSPCLDALSVPGVEQVFPATSTSWRFGPFLLDHSRLPACGYRRTPAHIRRDSLDHWLIAICREGRQRQRSGDVITDVTPGQPFVFSMAEPFEAERAGPVMDWLTLYVPRDAVPELEAVLAAAANGPLHGAMACVLADMLTSLPECLPAVTAPEAPHFAAAIQALPRGACTGREAAPDALVAAGQLARLRRLIRDNLASASLGPQRLCRLARISRSQLYRLFEPFGGVARYIQQERLRAVYRRLADPLCDHAISPIAEACGFFDASTFSRAFRKEFGCTPGEVRAAARAGQPLLPRRGPAGAADSLGALLRDL